MCLGVDVYALRKSASYQQNFPNPLQIGDSPTGKEKIHRLVRKS